MLCVSLGLRPSSFLVVRPCLRRTAVDPDDEFADDEDVYGEVLDAEEDVQDDGEGEGEDVEFGAPAGGDGDDGGDSEYSAPKPLNVPVGPKSYFWESVGLFVVFLYIVVYINGTRANNATANAWCVSPLKHHAPVSLCLCLCLCVCLTPGCARCAQDGRRGAVNANVVHELRHRRHVGLHDEGKQQLLQVLCVRPRQVPGIVGDIGRTCAVLWRRCVVLFAFFNNAAAAAAAINACPCQLKKRHDLLSMVLSLVWPAEDTVTIDIPLESMHPYVMAVVLKSDRKTVQDETQDLLNFARPVKSDSGLPDQFVVLADSPSVVPLVLRPEIVGPIKKHQHLVKIVHVTDSVPMSSVGTGRLSRMAVRLQFLMPAAEDMAAMVDLIKLSLALIDVASGARLAEKAMKHAQALRNKAKEQSLKEERERLQEAAAQRKAERVAKEREEMRKLPREEQRKRDEKERKRQLKKQMRSRVRVVG